MHFIVSLLALGEQREKKEGERGGRQGRKGGREKERKNRLRFAVSDRQRERVF